MTYAHLFAPPHHAYGADTGFLDSHAPIGLWEDGTVDQFESGDVYGADYFGAFNVGDKRSSRRNQAFEILKKISSAISHSRSFSADRFRGMTRAQAASARGEVARALKTFAKDNQVSLSNPLDPLATYSTAEANLGKVASYAPPPPPTPQPEPEPEPSNAMQQFYLESGGVGAPDPGLFAPVNPGYTTPGASTLPATPAWGVPPGASAPPAESPTSMWKSPWVWAGIAAAFGVVGLGAFLLFRDKTPAALPLPQAPLGAQNYWR